MKRYRQHAIILFSLLACGGATAATHNSPTRARIQNGYVMEPIFKTSVPARSLENPETDCIATEASFCYTGDFMSGAGGYLVILSNAGLDKQNPTHSGQMARLYLLAEPPADPANPQLPTGTFQAMTEDEFVNGYFVANSTDFLDIFPNPENPDSGELVCYSWISTGGTVTISETEDGYKVEADLEAVFSGEEEGDPETVRCTASYSGEVPYVNYFAYDPVPEDRTVEITGVSGRYMDGGDYSIAFYNVPLDEDGFIIGPGDLINMECFVEPKDKMDLDQLCQTFTPVDYFEEGMVAGRFMEGIWYNLFGEVWVAYGTALSVYQEDGSIQTGLATGGTVTFSKADKEDEYTVVLDLVTPEDKKITATWTGRLGDYILDDSTSGIDSVSGNDSRIIGHKGYIECPDGARIYNLSGEQTSGRDLQPGVYIVRYGSETKKVIVR